MPGRGLGRVDFGFSGYVPEFTAGRGIFFPWDGSLRSALFPREEYPAACLQQWISDVRYSRDRILSVRSDLTFHNQRKR